MPYKTTLLIENSLLNQTNNATLKSLEEKLQSLGFAPWMSVMTTFVLPVINFLGVIGCSLSLWIFLRKKFVDSVFFYYRLLCAINTVYLLHNIPACVLFSPRYFPNANTWSIAVFKAYYAVATNLLFQYGDVLQMGILLARMKIYSPFVKKHFKATPRQISLAFFLTCVLINIPLVFAFKVVSYGGFYYNNTSLNQQKNSTLYYHGGSDFRGSLFGKVLIGFFGLFINLFGSLVAGVTLNIVSYLKYKQYVNERNRKDEEIQLESMAITIQPCTSNSLQNNQDQQNHLKKLTQKELNEMKAEKNMFHMIITLCLISIVSRIILISCNLYAVFFFSLSNILALVIMVLDYFIYALVPSVSIFIFIAFNKMFRKEFKTIFRKKTVITVSPPQSSSSNSGKRS